MVKKTVVAVALVLVVAALFVVLAQQGEVAGPTVGAADAPAAALTKERPVSDPGASQPGERERSVLPTDAASTGPLPAARRLAKLSGWVYDSTGAGVDGVDVRVRSIAGNAPAGREFQDDRSVDVSLVSSAGETFSCADLPEGPFEVLATAKDGRLAKRRLAVTPDERETLVRLELGHPRLPAEVFVVVDDERGVPVQGALVEFVGLTAERKLCGMDGVPPLTALTDAAGAAALRGIVPGLPGWGVLFASVPDGRCAFLSLIHARGSGLATRLRLAPTARFHGRLVGLAADVTSGDEVEVHAHNTFAHNLVGPSYGKTFSTPVVDGRFALEGLPAGRLVVTLRSPSGHRLALQRKQTPRDGDSPNALMAVTIELAPGANLEQDLIITSGGGVAGIVHDEQGNPVEGARVRIVDAGSVELLRGSHDAPDAPFWIVGEPHDPIRRLHPQVGAEVRTDESGCYVVKGLQPGPHFVEVTAPRLAHDAETCLIADGVTVGLRHTLVRGGALQGAVPEGVATLTLVPAGSTRPYAIAHMGEPVFTFPWLAPGDYDLVARTADDRRLEKVLARVTITAGRTTWVDLRRANTVRHAGMVVGTEGPLAGARVSVREICVVTDEQGRFAFDHLSTLAPGCNLEVRHEGTYWRIALSDCSADNLVVRLPEHAVTVQTQDASGRPIAALVELWPEWINGLRSRDRVEQTLAVPCYVMVERASARSDSAGKIVFRHLPPENYLVRMRCADGSSMSTKFSVPVSGNVVMRARAVGVVELLVVDRQGAPIAGDTACAQTWVGDGTPPEDAKAFGQHSISVRGVTDVNGRVVLRDVPAGEIRAWTRSSEPEPVIVSARTVRRPTEVAQRATLEPGQHLVLRLTNTR